MIMIHLRQRPLGRFSRSARLAPGRCALFLLPVVVCLLPTAYCPLGTAADLRDYGARYDDASPAAIAANDQAVLDLQAALPISGGTIDLLPGWLHTSKTIRNPIRIQAPPGSPGPCPIHFAIDGAINSFVAIHTDSGAYAVDLSPTTPALYRDGNVRLRLSSVTLVGVTSKPDGTANGLNLYAGGKFTTLRELRITGCDVPINAKYFDGGCLDDVYCVRNRGPARFDTCMLMQCVRFTVRESSRDGLWLNNCMGWSGQIYLESNLGWQGDFNRLQGSNVTWWLEDHGRGPFRPLARERHCFGNVRSGQTQGDRVFDSDPISKLLNRTLTNERQFPPIGEPVGKATDFAVYSGAPLFASDGTGMTAICRPGCFGRPNQMYGEIRGFTDAGGVAHAWKQGDYLEVKCDVVTDELTRTYCGSSLPFVLNTAGGTFPQAKENVRIDGESTHVSFRGPAISDGAGVRVFVYLLGPKMPVNTQEVRFKFQNVVVRHLNNQVDAN